MTFNKCTKCFENAFEKLSTKNSSGIIKLYQKVYQKRGKRLKVDIYILIVLDSY